MTFLRLMLFIICITILPASSNGGPSQSGMSAATAIKIGQKAFDESDWSRAFAALSRACDLDVMEGCSALGSLYINGNGVAKDEARGVALIRKACTAGDNSGCGRLGSVLILGAGGTPVDIKQGRSLLEMSCKNGFGRACFNLGFYHSDGKLLKSELPVALKYFEQGCAAQLGASCVQAGLILKDGTAGRTDPAQAMKLFEKGCVRFSGGACFHAGLGYALGDIAIRNYPRAIDFYKLACHYGEGSGCYNLALLYNGTEGITPDAALARQYFDEACSKRAVDGCGASIFDPANVSTQGGAAAIFAEAQAANGKDVLKSRALYEKACNLGHGRACSITAEQYEYGNRNPPIVGDTAKAYFYYHRACDELKYAESCFQLGEIYIKQHNIDYPNVARNETAGVRYLQFACDNFVTAGCYRLGRFYLKGNGQNPFTSPQPQKAIEIFKALCAKGGVSACGYLGKMTLAGNATKKDLKLAYQYLLPNCRRGDGYDYNVTEELLPECAEIADMLYVGRGVAKTPSEAMDIYDTLAQHNAKGKEVFYYRKAMAYATGIGRTKNDAWVDPLLLASYKENPTYKPTLDAMATRGVKAPVEAKKPTTDDDEDYWDW